jgi:hypothetical protein
VLLFPGHTPPAGLLSVFRAAVTATLRRSDMSLPRGVRGRRNFGPPRALITYGTGEAGIRVSRVTHRWLRAARRRFGRAPRWLPPVRQRTVLAGVALGAVLLVALTLAGAVGIDPLPGFDSVRPAARQDASRGAVTAVQPEVERSLLDPADLPPGYSAAVTPPTTGAGAGVAGLGPQGDSGEGTGPAGVDTPASPGLELLPGLGLPPLGDALDLDSLDDLTGGGSGSSGQDPGDLPDPDGQDQPDPDPSDEAPSTPDEPIGPDDPGEGPDADGPGRVPEAEDPRKRSCRRLLVSAWSVAAAGARPIGTPQSADNVDRKRNVRLRQALGAFAGDGAAQAAGRIRRAVAACPRFTARSYEVTIEPVSGQPPTVGTNLLGGPVTADESYTWRVTAAPTRGRPWTGYLALDRVGSVLSVLWHLGPGRAVSAAEVTDARRAAVAKAQPLAGLLDR